MTSDFEKADYLLPLSLTAFATDDVSLLPLTKRVDI
jgi:hypothetical protein